MKNLPLILFLLLQAPVFAQYEPDTNYVYSAQDTIGGQLETAKRLKHYMELKDYDQAIQQFSSSYQKKIQAIRSNPEEFGQWVAGWSLTEKMLDQYFRRIREGRGRFVFENGAWRIHEN